MSNDNESVRRLVDELESVRTMFDNLEIGNLDDAESRLVKATYELDTATQYAEELDAVSVQDMARTAETLRNSLLQGAEGGTVPGDSMEFISKEISHLGEIVSRLSFYHDE